MTFQVDILNPKATQLLRDLADLNLISITEQADDNFLKTVKKLRKKATLTPPSYEEITQEMENVRAKRYASKKN